MRHWVKLNTEEKHYYQADELHCLYLSERFLSELLNFNVSLYSVSRHCEITLANIPPLNQTFVEFDF